jgi:hypothetical protein
MIEPDCPKCGAKVPLEGVAPPIDVTCPACGAIFRRPVRNESPPEMSGVQPKPHERKGCLSLVLLILIVLALLTAIGFSKMMAVLRELH